MSSGTSSDTLIRYSACTPRTILRPLSNAFPIPKHQGYYKSNLTSIRLLKRFISFILLPPIPFENDQHRRKQFQRVPAHLTGDATHSRLGRNCTDAEASIRGAFRQIIQETEEKLQRPNPRVSTSFEAGTIAKFRTPGPASRSKSKSLEEEKFIGTIHEKNNISDI